MTDNASSQESDALVAVDAEEDDGAPAQLSVSPTEMLANFDGAGVLLDQRGKIIATNPDGQSLATAFSRAGDPRIRGLVAEAIGSGRTICEKIEVAGADGNSKALEAMFLPLNTGEAGRYVVVMAREFTVERNFMNALMTSRQLFKDLVSCSADFAWETDHNGNFKFVSERGVLGYSAHELNGRPPRNLIDAKHPPDAPFPFDSNLPIEDAEVWLRHADGSASCLVISSVPVHSEDGEWLGARGVARDVTETRERDLALERERNRIELLNTIVDAIRNEIDPSRMLGTAAEATAAVVGARNCWVLRGDIRRGFATAAEFGGSFGVSQPSATDAVAEVLLHGDPRGVVERSVGLQQVLTAACRYRGEVNGAIAVACGGDQAEWGDDAKALLAGVADRIGLAIEQIAAHEQLEKLSRTDELTGLFNRRAFYEELEGRLAHHRRTGRSGALIYVDLDNFKMVNDVHGHQQGDEVLRLISDILDGGSRIGDLTARMGGDEFAVWTEDTDDEGAVTKARILLSDAESLKSHSASEAYPLGISIGIAVSDPKSEEMMDALIARADAAMYEVKNDGKGGFAASLPDGEMVRG